MRMLADLVGRVVPSGRATDGKSKTAGQRRRGAALHQPHRGPMLVRYGIVPRQLSHTVGWVKIS
jgi:hypothetical protein